MIVALILPLLENSVNTALQRDPDALHKIAKIKNQLIKIDCIDWKMVFYIVPDKSGLQFYARHDGKPNTEIKGTLNHFLAIFIKGADTKTLFQYPIDVSGNTHNIEVLRDAFKNLDLDLEEKCSHIIGDIAAHKLFLHLKNTKKILKKTNEKFIAQLKEYIHFEAKNFVSRKQAERFYDDIAKLRDDVARLEARCAQASA